MSPDGGGKIESGSQTAFDVGRFCTHRTASTWIKHGDSRVAVILRDRDGGVQ
jgi:hypothetical protein